MNVPGADNTHYDIDLIPERVTSINPWVLARTVSERGTATTGNGTTPIDLMNFVMRHYMRYGTAWTVWKMLILTKYKDYLILIT